MELSSLKLLMLKNLYNTIEKDISKFKEESKY